MTVKNSQHDPRGAKYRRMNRDAPLGQAEMNTIIDAHYRLQKRIETMNRAWLESMREAWNEEIELSRRLRDCSGPPKVVGRCDAWLATRSQLHRLYASDVDLAGGAASRRDAEPGGGNALDQRHLGPG